MNISAPSDGHPIIWRGNQHNLGWINLNPNTQTWTVNIRQKDVMEQLATCIKSLEYPRITELV